MVSRARASRMLWCSSVVSLQCRGSFFVCVERETFADHNTSNDGGMECKQTSLDTVSELTL